MFSSRSWDVHHVVELRDVEVLVVHDQTPKRKGEELEVGGQGDKVKKILTQLRFQIES